MTKTDRRKRRKKAPAVPAAWGLHKAVKPKDMVLNSRVRDSSSYL